jgi:uncharacterized protein YcbK (DUF882 family)
MSDVARALGVIAVGVVVAGFPAFSRADVQHVIARGHTIEAIAHRYHVPPKAILDANHLKDARHLKVGDTLVIPGVQPDKDKGAPGSKKAKAGEKPASPTYAMRAKTPGVVHATRLSTSESVEVRVNDRRGKQPPPAEKTFERVMRAASGLTHPIDPRLIALVGVVSNHFGSRRIEIVSGFRPYSPTQHTAHSNHNIGKAIDFRVQGVPNEVVRDFCRTLHNVGCGYYPHSTFVHMDVRGSTAFWIDYSRPGEPPRYNASDVEADEGTSDVMDEAAASGDSVSPPSSGGANVNPAPPATTAPNADPGQMTPPAAPAPSAAPAEPEYDADGI